MYELMNGYNRISISGRVSCSNRTPERLLLKHDPLSVSQAAITLSVNQSVSQPVSQSLT